MPAIAHCPDDDTLQQLLLGTVNPEQWEALSSHLIDCVECVHRAETIAASDELTAALTLGAELLAQKEEGLPNQLRDQLIRLREAPQRSGPTTAPTVSIAAASEPSVVNAASAASKHSDAGDFSFLLPPQADDEIGRLGPYRVLKVLGKGGMGVVFQAEDVRLGRHCALKAMLPAVASKPGMKERFLREARAAAQIEHDNIIPIYQVDEAAGVPYIAMPLLKGMPLEDWIRKQIASTGNATSIPVAAILRLARQIAKGLAAAHDRGLIHRDIKPANIWLDASASGRVKILDFGLARLSEAADQQLTQSGTIMGTPSYMAPEQARGEKLDGRADLFSLGVILYRLTTGNLPFEGKDTLSTLMSLATHSPPAPRAINPTLPQPLSELVMKLLEKDANDRIASAQQVLSVIQEIEKGLMNGAAGTLPKTAAVPLSAEPVSVSGAPRAHVGQSPSDAKPRAIPIGTAEELPKVTIIADHRHPAQRPPRYPVLRMAMGGAAAVLLAGILFFWQTRQGTVRIEINDPQITARIDAQGVDIKKGGQQFIRLAPGEHGFKVKHRELEFDTDKFVLGRGETVDVKVELVRGRIRVVAGDREIGSYQLSESAAGNGFISLFNGKDLSGWVSAADGSDRWRVEDDALVGTKGKSSSFLQASMAPAGVLFRTDYQLADDGSGGVAIGLPGNRHLLVEIRSPPSKAGGALLIATGLLSFPGTGYDPNRSFDWWCQYPPRQKPLGQWNTLEIAVAGGELVVSVNNREVNRRSIASIPPLDAAVRSGEPLAAMLLPDVKGRLRFRRLAYKPIAAAPASPDYFRPTPGVWTSILTNPDDFARAPKRGNVRLEGGVIDIRSGKFDVPEEWTGEANALGIEAPIVGRNVVLRAKVKKLAGSEAGLWTRHLTSGGGGVVMFRGNDGPRLATWGGSDSRTHAAVPAKADADGFIDVAIAVIDKSAILFVNGVRAGEGTEDQIHVNQINIVAFRTDDDPGKEVHFQLKDLRIFVLDGTNITPEQAIGIGSQALPNSGEEWTPLAKGEGIERDVAHWVVTHGGEVELSIDGTFTSLLRTAEEIPGAKFEVASIYLMKQFDADDAFLAKCQGLKSLQTLVLHGQPVTNKGLNSFLGSSATATLRTFGLIHDKIGDGGLAELSRLSKLTSLTLRSPQMTDATMRQLASLPLSFVDLGNSGISGEGLAMLRTKQLAHLNLGYCGFIDDEAMAQLANQAKLGYLNLSGTQVGDAGLAQLQGLSSLASLDLAECKVTDSGLERLSQFPNLAALTLKRLTISDKGLTNLTKVPKLTTLDLTETEVTDQGISHLAGLNLIELHLSGTEVTDDGLAVLAQIKTLKRLYLAGSRVTPDGVNRLSKALPECQIQGN